MTRDEKRMLKAMQEIRDLAKAVKGGADRGELYNVIGRMQAIAEFHSDPVFQPQLKETIRG